MSEIIIVTGALISVWGLLTASRGKFNNLCSVLGFFLSLIGIILYLL